MHPWALYEISKWIEGWGLTLVIIGALSLGCLKLFYKYWEPRLTEYLTKLATGADHSIAHLPNIAKSHVGLHEKVDERAAIVAAQVSKNFLVECRQHECPKVSGLVQAIRELEIMTDQKLSEQHACLAAFCAEGRQAREDTAKAVTEIQHTVMLFTNGAGSRIVEALETMLKWRLQNGTQGGQKDGG